MSNGRNLKTIFEKCTFENNTSQNNLINIFNVFLDLQNCNFHNNQGRVISASNVEIYQREINISDHKCSIIGYEGCLHYVERQTLVHIDNFSVINLISNFTNDLFKVLDSTIIINNITIKYIRSISSTIFLYGKRISLIFENSFLQCINKSLIYLEDSNISIVNCNFYKLISDIPIQYFFHFETSSLINLINNTFEQCITQGKTCLELHASIHFSLKIIFYQIIKNK